MANQDDQQNQPVLCVGGDIAQHGDGDPPRLRLGLRFESCSEWLTRKVKPEEAKANEVNLGYKESPMTGMKIGSMPPELADNSYWMGALGEMKVAASLPDHWVDPLEVDENLQVPLESNQIPNERNFYAPCTCRIRFSTGKECLPNFCNPGNGNAPANTLTYPIPVQAKQHWAIHIKPYRQKRICPRAWVRYQNDPSKGLIGCRNIFTVMPSWGWIAQLGIYWNPLMTGYELKHLYILENQHCARCKGAKMDSNTNIVIDNYNGLISRPDIKTPILYLWPNSKKQRWSNRDRDRNVDEVYEDAELYFFEYPVPPIPL